MQSQNAAVSSKGPPLLASRSVSVGSTAATTTVSPTAAPAVSTVIPPAHALPDDMLSRVITASLVPAHAVSRDELIREFIITCLEDPHFEGTFSCVFVL